MILRTFDDRLRWAIKQKGINQKQLATLIGVSEPIVSCWVRGKRIPRAKNLFFLADILGVSADWLMNGDCHDT